jgi:hypothetical protein
MTLMRALLAAFVVAALARSPRAAGIRRDLPSLVRSVRRPRRRRNQLRLHLA